MPVLEHTWRWYGPQDPVSLAHVKQAGATGIVTALHHIPIGEVWTEEEIIRRKHEIEAAGLSWSVIESLPVHESIKTQTGSWQVYLANYRQSLANIGACGLDTLCYNFMPVLDWTRTQLNAPFGDGSTALQFDWIDFAVFDVFILKRTGAETDYSAEILSKAEARLKALPAEARADLVRTIIMGLPGTDQHFGVEDFREAVAQYKGMDAEVYRSHVKTFLEAVVPTAIEQGIKMAVHPDDPPFNIFGLPRIVSTAEDVRKYFAAYDHPNNGLTLCTGSFGARMGNNLTEMVREFRERIHFVHLRNVKTYAELSFHEDNHLEGDVDMLGVMREFVQWTDQQPRGSRRLPYRPDHGHRMLDDLDKQVNPGYSGIGRLRGLAELRGLEMGIRGHL
ncbi:MAG: mannonate dehydratase [Bacteroidota bacterium]